jgi:hypothetical protein
MGTAPSYAEIVALGMVRQQLSKRLIGKPYIKYGQCAAIWLRYLECSANRPPHLFRHPAIYEMRREGINMGRERKVGRRFR